MEAVFDAADDTLKVSKESGHDLLAGGSSCAGKHVEESWAKLTQNKRKKKKKKRKKDEETEEEAMKTYEKDLLREIPGLRRGLVLRRGCGSAGHAAGSRRRC